MDACADNSWTIELELYGALGLLVQDGEGVVLDGSTARVTLAVPQGATVRDALECLAASQPRTRAIAEGRYAIIVLANGRSVPAWQYATETLIDKAKVQLLEIYTGG